MSRSKQGPCFWIIVAGVVALLPGWATSQEPAAEPEEKQEKPEVEEPLDARGRYKEKSVNVSSRYYIWVDSRGWWHVRTASKKGIIQRFHGKIGVKNGQIDRVKAIGLETRGKTADTLNPDAAGRHIVFSLYTGGSFDGFDFTVEGDENGRVVFELYQTKRESRYPNQIFLGSKGQHPVDVKFSLRADGEPDEIEEASEEAERADPE